MSQHPMDKHRIDIDALDDAIVGLLNKRAQEVEGIGRIKAKKGEQVFASEREREILDRLTRLNDGALPPEAVQDIFKSIFTAYRSLQSQLRIAYFGPEATFTHQLALKHFGRNGDYMAL